MFCKFGGLYSDCLPTTVNTCSLLLFEIISLLLQRKIEVVSCCSIRGPVQHWKRNYVRVEQIMRFMLTHVLKH